MSSSTGKPMPIPTPRPMFRSTFFAAFSMLTMVLEIGARNGVELGGTYDTGLPFEPENVAALDPKGCREVTRSCDVSGNTAAIPDSTAVVKVEVDTVRVEVCKDAGQTIRPVDMQLTPV